MTNEGRMTNEEIIKGLQAVNEHIGKHFNESGAWMAEFIDNAIKALEQQPCEDCISKEKMIKVIERMEKLEEDLYRTEGAESSFATLCLCVEWIKEALE